MNKSYTYVYILWIHGDAKADGRTAAATVALALAGGPAVSWRLARSLRPPDSSARLSVRPPDPSARCIRSPDNLKKYDSAAKAAGPKNMCVAFQISVIVHC